MAVKLVLSMQKKENIKITIDGNFQFFFKNQNFRSRYEKKRANKSIIGTFEVKGNEVLRLSENYLKQSWYYKPKWFILSRENWHNYQSPERKQEEKKKKEWGSALALVFHYNIQSQNAGRNDYTVVRRKNVNEEFYTQFVLRQQSLCTQDLRETATMNLFWKKKLLWNLGR